MKKANKYKAIFDTDEAKEQFGVKKPRVQFFFATPRRRDFALKEFSKDYPNQMFWLATFPDINAISARMFQTPKDFPKKYELLDVIV